MADPQQNLLRTFALEFYKRGRNDALKTLVNTMGDEALRGQSFTSEQIADILKRISDAPLALPPDTTTP